MHTPTVPELLAWLLAQRLRGIRKFIYYMAPMDLKPVRIPVLSPVKTYKNPKRFAFSVKGSGMRFRIDEKHLDRIYVPDADTQKEVSL